MKWQKSSTQVSPKKDFQKKFVRKSLGQMDEFIQTCNTSTTQKEVCNATVLK